METQYKPPWWEMEFPPPPKPWPLKHIMVIIIVMIAVTNIGVRIYQAQKEPVVSIFGNSIQIEAVYYKLNVDFSTITSISLLERSMRDIAGDGFRVGGSGGFGRFMRGDFQSHNLGTVSLFVQFRSSPTIWIERYDQKDIYINFRDRKKTETLYNEISAATRK